MKIITYIIIEFVETYLDTSNGPSHSEKLANQLHTDMSLMMSRLTIEDTFIRFGTDINLAPFAHEWTTFSTQPNLVNANPGKHVRAYLIS